MILLVSRYDIRGIKIHQELDKNCKDDINKVLYIVFECIILYLYILCHQRILSTPNFFVYCLLYSSPVIKTISQFYLFMRQGLVSVAHC